MSGGLALMAGGGCWDDERLDLLAKLWGTGLSAAQIAKRLDPFGGISRSAVIGKARRLIDKGILRQITDPTAPGGESTPRAGRPRRILDADAPRIKKAAAALRKARGEAPAPKVAKVVEPIVPQGPPRTEPVEWPGRGQCKWPIGDPADQGFHFCANRAAPAADGEPGRWCEDHHELGHAKQSPSQKGAVNLARALRRFI